MINKPLNWNKLKNNLCPKCGRDITRGIGQKIVHKAIAPTPVLPQHLDGSTTTIDAIPTEKAITHSCGFVIRESRFKQIVNGMITRDLEEQLDREEVQE